MKHLWIICLPASLMFFSCQADKQDEGDRSVAQAASADEAAADTIRVTANYPDLSFLRGPAEIDAWVNYVNAHIQQYEQKGPYTIVRLDGNYEVTAFLAEGEIILLHCFTPGGLGQQWYYLNQYIVPTLRELGYPELTHSTWQGMYVPARVPAPVVVTLYQSITRIVEAPWFAEKLKPAGVIVLKSGTLAECAAFTKSEVEFWAKIVNDMGLAGSM